MAAIGAIMFLLVIPVVTFSQSASHRTAPYTEQNVDVVLTSHAENILGNRPVWQVHFQQSHLRIVNALSVGIIAAVIETLLRDARHHLRLLRQKLIRL